MNKEALIYLRVSTEIQEDKESLQKQREQALKFLEFKGFKLYKIIEEVESGRKSSRAGLVDLISEIEERKFDVLVFYELSRLGRVQYDIHKILHLLKLNEIEYASVTESYITSENDVGKMVVGFLASMAELESDRISKRVKGRMQFYASQGYFLNKPPFGYGLGKDKILFIVEEEAEVVKNIYDEFISGKGMLSIGRKFGKSSSQIRNILKNNTYAGRVIHGREKKDINTGKTKFNTDFEIYKGLHEAIIEPEKFDLVQKIIDEKRMRKIKGVDNISYLLGGLVSCGICGKKMYGYATTSRYYRCTGKAKGACAGSSYIAADVLEKSVIDELIKFSENNFDFLDYDADDPPQKDNSDKIKRLKEKKSRIAESYSDMAISRDKYKEGISKIEKEIKELSTVKPKKNLSKNLKEYFIEVFNKYEAAETIDKKRILQTIIYEIVVKNKEEFELVLAV